MGLNQAAYAQEPPRAEVDARKGPAVVEFGVDWCPHCQRAQPLIAQAFETHSRVHHLRVEDGKGRPLGRSFAVKLWPTLIFLRDGKEIARLVRPTDARDVEAALALIDTPQTV
jgi:thioredoxin 1